MPLEESVEKVKAAPESLEDVVIGKVRKLARSFKKRFITKDKPLDKKVVNARIGERLATEEKTPEVLILEFNVQEKRGKWESAPVAEEIEVNGDKYRLTGTLEWWDCNPTDMDDLREDYEWRGHAIATVRRSGDK